MAVQVVLSVQVAISVTELASFVHKRGDIDERSEEMTTSREGIASQKAYQNRIERQHKDYEKEIKVSREYKTKSASIKVSGRIDGLLKTEELTGKRLVVEEIKTTRKDVSDLPLCDRSVHQAQVKLYASMLDCVDEYKSIATRLTYINPDSGSHTSEDEECDVADLELYFDETVGSYLTWLATVDDRLQKRNNLAKKQEFPFTSYNENQLNFARHGYQSLRDKKNLLMEAPTGTGKTIATLFPAVKAVGENKLDRVVFSTARTTGQAAATDAFKSLSQDNPSLVQVTVSAKDRVCLTPGAACRPEECEYAKGHYDRVRSATELVLKKGNVDRVAIDAMAKSKRVCPFELSLDAAEWADVVICDYNYVFDPLVQLKRLQSRFFKRVGLLVDEAHRLTERVRSMLTCEIDMSVLGQAVEITKGTQLGSLLATVNQCLLDVLDEALPQPAERTLDEIDEDVILAIERLDEVDMNGLNVSGGETAEQDLEIVQECLFTFFRFRSIWQIADSAREKFTWLARREDEECTLELHCLLPDTWISKLIESYHGSIRFSGTLSPGELFNEEHGLDGPILRGTIEPDSRKLGVFVVPDISTYFNEREHTAPALAQLVRQIHDDASGNWLVAFPSFAYLNMVHEVMDRDDILVQESNMSLENRENFLANLTAESSRIGFIVMGGVFAESIDLEPEALEGVIVVSPGIPPRSLTSEKLAALSPNGYELAYRRPAMTRVVQAAGRVVRSKHDRGMVILVDPRFTRSDFKRYFPSHWQSQVVKSDAIPAELTEFRASA